MSFFCFRRPTRARFLVLILLLTVIVSLINHNHIVDVGLTLPQMVKYTSERVSLQTTTKQNIISTEQQNIAKISFRRGLVDTVNAATHSSADARGLNLGGNRIHERKSAFEERVIRILTWTNVSIGVNHWFGKHLEGVAKCNTPISCEYSNNRSLYNISDLILFHTRLAIRNDAMPSYRLPHQHWITFLSESPIRLLRINHPHNSWFNWTIAYTLKADIARPYGICLPKMETIAKDPSSITDAIRRVYRTRTDSFPWQTENETNLTRVTLPKVKLALCCGLLATALLEVKEKDM